MPKCTCKACSCEDDIRACPLCEGWTEEELRISCKIHGANLKGHTNLHATRIENSTINSWLQTIKSNLKIQESTFIHSGDTFACGWRFWDGTNHSYKFVVANSHIWILDWLTWHGDINDLKFNYIRENR
jgi:hypothetical protein